MAARRSTKRNKSIGKPEEATTGTDVKIAIDNNRTATPLKSKKRRRQRAGISLDEALKDLKTAQAKVKREHQARIQAEKALIKAQKDLAIASRGPQEAHPTQMRRVSFVVRLTIDQRGQPHRTEIEDVTSSRRQNFPGFDSERLVAFMKECIPFPLNSVPGIPMSSTPGGLSPQVPFRQELVISKVRVFHLENPDSLTLVASHDAPFGLEASFQLQGSDDFLLAIGASSFDLKVYANEISTGRCRLLTVCREKLIKDSLGYKVAIKVPGLSGGLFRLLTVVMLNNFTNLAGFYGKTIVRII